jgi:hypothetical protein
MRLAFKRGLGAVALGVVAVLARGPLHLVTFGLPVSNDDAILLLMARHLLHGELATTLWNQPYNGALDAYLLAPLVWVLGHHHAFRVYQALCAGLLVLLAFLLGRRVGGENAGWAAALLAAWGTPYMALMTCTGPPPNFLMPLVTGFPLVAGLRSLSPQAKPLGPTALFLLGLVCGLAVWNSSLAIPAFVGMGAGLLLAGFRPRLASLMWGAGFAVGASPLLLARMIGASGARVVTASSAVTAMRPRWLWAAGLRDLASALSGLVGIEIPLVVDGPERAHLPKLALALALGLALFVLVLVALYRRRRAWPLLLWALGLCGAFFLSRRTGPDQLRYLYGVSVPLLVLAGCGLAWLSRRRPLVGAGLALALLLPWGLGQRALLRVWRDPTHAVKVWQVPSVTPALAALDAAGVKSAYASLQFAGRLTLESEGLVIASQAWNERIPGDPLRFRDEVDLDPSPAFVLSPVLSRGMPRAPRFQELVRELGGSCVSETAGDLVVFHGFRGPFDESRPVPPSAMRVDEGSGSEVGATVLDRDPQTVWVSPSGLGRGSSLSVRFEPARRLDALVLGVDLLESPLAVPWIASIDGHLVAQGPLRNGFQWQNGAPRAGKQGLLVVTLGGLKANEVRLVFQGPGPRLRLSEVFAYGPDETQLEDAGAVAAARLGLDAARRGQWDGAVSAFELAVKYGPQRASLYASLARARWRQQQRRRLDVEGLDDGGPDLVLPRP